MASLKSDISSGATWRLVTGFWGLDGVARLVDGVLTILPSEFTSVSAVGLRPLMAVLVRLIAWRGIRGGFMRVAVADFDAVASVDDVVREVSLGVQYAVEKGSMGNE